MRAPFSFLADNLRVSAVLSFAASSRIPSNVVAPWHRAWIVMGVAAGLPRRCTARTVSFPRDAASRLPRDAAAGSPPMAPPKRRPAHDVVRKPSQGLENKKSVRIATFLRLGIVAWFQIASRGVKTRIIGHKAAYFRFTGAEGSP